MSLIFFAMPAISKTMECKFEKKDPKGTVAEQFFKGFSYSLSTRKQKLTLSNLDLTKEALSYADKEAGEEWPLKDTGTLNPDFPFHHNLAERHKNYQQYKNFKSVKANVRWSRFEVLVDEKGHVRIPITTNDGTWTEELFTCEESRGSNGVSNALEASQQLKAITCSGNDGTYPYFVYFGEDDEDFVKVVVKRKGRKNGNRTSWVVLSDESQQVSTGQKAFNIGIDELSLTIQRPLPTSKEKPAVSNGVLDLNNDGREIPLFCKHR
jgi:hypothetical protein